MKYVAYTVKGIEKTVIEELKSEIEYIKIKEVGEKYVLFDYTARH